VQRTIFDTPIVNTLLRAFSILALRITGWKVDGALPANAKKCVMIAAPHTSNWDLPLTLMVSFKLGLQIYWMGKASIFKRPFGALMRWLGGIPVNREKSNNLVAASAAALREAAHPMCLVVPPEGTRSKVRQWKTGFYYIALEANVPIVMAYMDYHEKRSGLGPMLMPTGNIEADMATVKAFYAPIRGKNALQFDAEG
jgi:1-acyl-sn-glycerol-3-phosphate acyltransferase